MHGIRGLDDDSIINAVKLSGFVVDRGESVENINPDEVTIQNVKIMIERSAEFIKSFNREVPGSICVLITSESRPTKEDIRHNLKHCSTKSRLDRAQQSQNIRYLAIYNPRLNAVYRTRADAISRDVITEVD